MHSISERASSTQIVHVVLLSLWRCGCLMEPIHRYPRIGSRRGICSMSMAAKALLPGGASTYQFARRTQWLLHHTSTVSDILRRMLPPHAPNTFQVLFVYAAHVVGVVKVSEQQLVCASKLKYPNLDASSH